MAVIPTSNSKPVCSTTFRRNVYKLSEFRQGFCRLKVELQTTSNRSRSGDVSTIDRFWLARFLQVRCVGVVVLSHERNPLASSGQSPRQLCLPEQLTSVCPTERTSRIAVSCIGRVGPPILYNPFGWKQHRPSPPIRGSCVADSNC